MSDKPNHLKELQAALTEAPLVLGTEMVSVPIERPVKSSFHLREQFMLIDGSNVYIWADGEVSIVNALGTMPATLLKIDDLDRINKSSLAARSEP